MNCDYEEDELDSQIIGQQGERRERLQANDADRIVLAKECNSAYSSSQYHMSNDEPERIYL